MGRFNFIKLEILSKLIYQFKAILIKTPTVFFTGPEVFWNIKTTKSQE